MQLHAQYSVNLYEICTLEKIFKLNFTSSKFISIFILNKKYLFLQQPQNRFRKTWQYVLIGLFPLLIGGHEFIIYAILTRQRSANNLTLHCKNQTDISFLCLCPVIGHAFRHKIVKVVCGSTRLSPHGSTVPLTMLL